MPELHLVLLAVGAAVLGVSLFTRPIEASVLSGPLLMVGLGVLLGPAALGLLHPEQWGPRLLLLEETARVTIAIALLSIALRLPTDFVPRHRRSLALLLGLGMPLMWLVSALLSQRLLDAPLLVALLIGAAITPTDPVVSSSIVTGSVAERHLPGYYRHTVSAESGANDGLAYPLVMLPILLLQHPAGQALGDWALHSVLREVGGAVVLGIALGLAAGRLLRWAEARGFMEQTSFLAYTVALSLLALGLAKAIGTDGLVGVFVTGLAFDHVVGGRERAQEADVQEAVNQFFTLPIFGLFGLLLPWQAWAQLGWPALALPVAILALRRPPAILLLARFMPVLQRKTEDGLYLGWFGPIGVAALFYAAKAVRETGHELVWTATSLVVLASLLAHGTSAAPLALRYGRRPHGGR